MQIEKTVVGLAWTSSSFLTQECGLCVHAVRSLRAYQHPPPVHERRKREVIQFASGPHKPHMQLHGLPSSRFLRHSHSACHGRPPCFLSASGETPSLHFVLQNVWPDPGNGAHLRKTKLHPPHQLSFPACVPGGRERHWWAVGRATSSGSQQQNRRHLRRLVGSPGSGGLCGREHSSFMACGWQGCEQGPPAPPRQLACSAVFAGSVKRTCFMGDIYHYPVLLKYSLCSRLELVRLLSSQVGG